MFLKNKELMYLFEKYIYLKNFWDFVHFSALVGFNYIVAIQGNAKYLHCRFQILFLTQSVILGSARRVHHAPYSLVANSKANSKGAQ